MPKFEHKQSPKFLPRIFFPGQMALEELLNSLRPEDPPLQKPGPKRFLKSLPERFAKPAMLTSKSLARPDWMTLVRVR